MFVLYAFAHRLTDSFNILLSSWETILFIVPSTNDTKLI